MMRPPRLYALLLTALLLVGPFGAGLAFAQASPFPFTTNTVFQDAATTTGNGATLNTGLTQTLGMQLIVTAGTVGIAPEGSLNGTTWTAITCYPTGSSTASTTPATSGLFRCNTLGVPQVRMRISSCSSCTVTVLGFATSVGPLPVDVP